MTRRAVGRPIIPVTGAIKVTGHGRFPPDYRPDDLLHIAAVRSEVSHARIAAVDTSQAEAMPGVHLVLTREALGFDEVARHVGDTIAVVVAETAEQAAVASRAVEVDYDRLPVVDDPEEALSEGAAVVGAHGGNLALEVDLDQGDVDAGMEEATTVVSGTYRTGRPTHCNLSPRTCIARLDPDGVVEVMSSLDAPFFSQRELAEELGVEPDRVRVVLPELASSSFGGRSGVNIHCEPVAARVAMRTGGRPVRLSYDPSEEFVAGTTRHAVTAHLVAGADEHGRVHTLDLELLADHGPYDNFVNRIVLGAGRDRPLDLLGLDNYRYRGRAVLTNNLMGGEMRGIGATQICHILGVHMDEMARHLEMDPVEFHLRNIPDKARGEGGLEGCLRAGAAAFDWPGPARIVPDGWRRGVGVGVGTHTTGLGTFHGSDNATARVAVDGSGVVTVATAAPDSGQGSTTIVAQIVAEELDVSPAAVRFRPIDTSSAPPDAWGSVASRGTYVVAAAVRLAAIDARERLIAAAGPPGDGLSLEALAAAAGGVVGEARAVTDDTPPTYGAYFADVDVDLETGWVEVRRFVAALDVGFAINPEQCRGQIEGALAHGLEFGLGAEVVMSGGMPENTSLVDYRVARAGDMPEIEVVLVEGAEEGGPYGARGIGTPAVTPVMPAIANAVRDALRVRPERVPMTPESLLGLLP